MIHQQGIKHVAENVDVGTLLPVKCFLTFILGVGACTDPGTAEYLFHSNEGFMSRDQDPIGDASGQ